MQFTLRFGSPVHAHDGKLGKLERIIVNNGIANQITVDPGLLGYERVVPLSDFEASDSQTLRLRINEDEWKSYPSYIMHSGFVANPNADTPSYAILPNQTIAGQARDTSHPLGDDYVTETRTTVDQMSVVLSASTVVVIEATAGDERKLSGLLIDTGRPIELLIEDGSSVPFSAVTMLDEERIHVGGQHQQPILPSDRGYEQTLPQDPAGDERR